MFNDFSMLKTENIFILLCLIVWAIGFFIYELGITIHFLLVLAAVAAITKVLTTNNDLK